MDLDTIRWLGVEREPVEAGKVERAETALGMRFPDGYRDYVGRFGEAILCTFVRVYPPARVLDDLAQWRERVGECWFWGRHNDGMDETLVQRAACIADTMNGDELIIHPDRPHQLYLLPRYDEAMERIDGGLNHALTRLCRHNELHYACSLRREELHQDYRPARRAVEPARARDALLAVHDDTPWERVHDEDDSFHVLLPALGGDAFIDREHGVMLTYEPAAPGELLARIDRALVAIGLDRVDHS